ncbi:unnamed protein product [Thelazia callipaeda]|uniref:Coiled-coil domain-containing protein 22 homolog n=1 Tax=Thelazia callipaeda TaxID=103827 RepID=A0A0N5CMP6_THECL|nr:unnamed protein product [Thelazia callipaeda]
MDIVDRQIIDTLLRLDPNFFDGFSQIPSSVADFHTETFYQAIVLLIWSCKRNIKLDVPSRLFPQSMSVKFRCAANVADAVKSIGVRDPFDYQMLLYGRSKELRNVLIGLIEKLPRDSAVITVVEGISEHYFLPWNSSASQATRFDFMGCCGDVMTALNCNDWRYNQSAFICSLLEHNAVGNSQAQTCQSIKNETLDASQTKYSTINKLLESRIRCKPSLFPKPRKEVQMKVKIPKEEINNEKLNKLINEVISLAASVNRKKMSEIKLRSEEAERSFTLNCKKCKESEVDGRLKKLLEDSNAVLKLKNYIEESDERMHHLQNVWFRAKAEKDEEVNTKRLAVSSSTNQIVAKEEKQIDRSIYTKHIFDMVSNIRKQQDEINKIAVENFHLQKEIKSIAGKLERCFTVVETKLYKDVERDASLQKAYRLLMKIHGKCAWIISSIDSSGLLEWKIEELNDQIAMQQQKKIDEKLERILIDWMGIKEENMVLTKLLNENN